MRLDIHLINIYPTSSYGRDHIKVIFCPPQYILKTMYLSLDIVVYPIGKVFNSKYVFLSLMLHKSSIHFSREPHTKMIYFKLENANLKIKCHFKLRRQLPFEHHFLFSYFYINICSRCLPVLQNSMSKIIKKISKQKIFGNF